MLVFSAAYVGMTEKEIKMDKSHILLARKKTQQEHHNNYRHNDNIPFVFAYNQADDGREIHSLTLWNSKNDVAAFLAQIHLAHQVQQGRKKCYACSSKLPLRSLQKKCNLMIPAN
jgi:hypothetical protein